MFEMDVVVFIIIGIFFLLIGYRPPWWSRKQKSECQKTVKDIPGPIALPFFGTGWVYTVFGGYKYNQIHEFYKQMFSYHGSIIKEEALWNIPVISIKDKDDIEKVFRQCGKYPVRPPTEAIAYYRKSKPERYASIGLVNEQGQAWHKLRVILTTELTSTRTISEFMSECSNIASDFCKLLAKERDKDGLVSNLENLTSRLGLEATCALVLGRRMGFLASDENHTELTKNLAEAANCHFVASRDTYYGLPFWKLWSTDAYKRLVKSEEDLYSMVSQLIADSDADLFNSSVFHSIINSTLDVRDKRANLIDLIAGGIKTLSYSLVFLFDLVGRHADVQKKLHECSRNEEQLHRAAYLKACVFEAFRMYPTAACIARILERDLELGGYHLEAGTVMLCHTGAACLEHKYFERSDQFRPERWTGPDKSAAFNMATYLVAPFGIGRRSCPGKRFVEQMLTVVLAQVVNEFEMQCTKPIEVQFEFLMAPKGPVHMKFTDRTD